MADLPMVRDWLRGAATIAVLSGAGISAESGVPTFRDAQTGLWARYDPQRLATEEGFRADPALVWNWYASRREKIAAVAPNAGHTALAQFALRHPGRMTVITQNVDGLHQRAGSPDVLALHGNIAEDKWLEPCVMPQRLGGGCTTSSAQPGQPPKCAQCGNLVRPAVVWFGEALPTTALVAAEIAAQRCDLMLVVGTSGEVYPAAGLAFAAHEAGAKVVVLNTEASALDSIAHAVLRGKSAELLPQLLEG
jgi:NAD-dependent deacetylase